MMHAILSHKIILRVVSNFLLQSNSNIFYKISLLGKNLEIEIQRRKKMWSNPL